MHSPAPEKLDSISLDHFFAQNNPFIQAKPVFDFHDVRLVTPSALVQLAATVHALALDGRRPVIRLNESPACSYLHRSGFTHVVADLADFEAPNTLPFARISAARQGTNPMLIEVTRIESGHSLPGVLNQIVWVLRHRLKYRKRDAFDIGIVISEVAQNTFDHNTSTCGFLAMQVYGRGTKRFLEIGVSDFRRAHRTQYT